MTVSFAASEFGTGVAVEHIYLLEVPQMDILLSFLFTDLIGQNGDSNIILLAVLNKEGIDRGHLTEKCSYLLKEP